MNLLNRLIAQAKNPNGFVGSVMLSIMNTSHTQMNVWAWEKVRIREDSVMLDVGCGGGRTIQLLSVWNPQARIYGIDYSEQAVKDSIRANKADIAEGKVHIQQASVTDIPFSDHTFDMITAFQTHYFWPDMENSLKEIFRVLKVEGCLLITAELYKINYHMKSYQTKEDMEQLLLKTGFSDVKIDENPTKKWIRIQGMKRT